MASKTIEISFKTPTSSLPHFPRNETCGFCGTAFWPYLKKCKRCNSKYYCNRSCQKQDWTYHKKDCSKPKLEPFLGTAESLWLWDQLTITKSQTPFKVTLLPDKVWLKIFEYLDTKDIVQGILCVLCGPE